jgi:nickel/cobalt exporter
LDKNQNKNRMTESFSALIISTITIAVIHAFAPDHWLPFVMIGKTQKWSRPKHVWITSIAGIGHVGSSVVLGGIGILLGIATIQLEGVEAIRGNIGVLLLIGFGIAYAVWGLKRSQNHHHHSFQLTDKKAVTLWTLFAVFVLGPCEPLIPLMFLATAYGVTGVVVVTAVFGLVTLLMMVGQTLLGASGIQHIKHELAERYSHAMAGFVIVLTGVFLLLI